MDILFSCPTKPKETGRHAEYSEQSRNETVFLCAEAMGDYVRFEIEVNVGAVDGDANDAGNDDAEKYYAQLAQVEVIDANIDDWKGFKEGVVDSVKLSVICKSWKS